ncbi:uncharacterized protein EV420DRAFT_1561150 [Desarmillaria tabescens]|uniref:F-box domain-containing protein n=1 Tax=Armillaria tabescens TaxID=1929756 RepID=A0AA39JY88_ARMTA|nr:uncharacterized protein EV420DRAFT_1561150 [Desarmillaria tabescens]KAK0451147.1 hypothetical protein EV420DRAFT_1561150 [Desarmillaria tabescens]
MSRRFRACNNASSVARGTDSALFKTSAPSLSRTKDLLHCNDPLLDVEKEGLRELIDGSYSALASLDQQIIEARQALDSLIQKRQLAESNIIDAKRLLHPMRSLPDDVLSEIFHHCVPKWKGIGFGLHNSLDPRRPPWTLSYVSRRWRDLSLSLPQLWTCIRLDFREYRAVSMRAMLTRLALILERSKNMDLFVALLAISTISDHPAFVLLDLSAPRWRRLSVCIPRACLQALSGTSFSRLEELSATTTRPNQDVFAAPVNTFWNTGSLRSVTILSNETCDSVTRDSAYRLFPPPWSGIETYMCNPSSRDDWDHLKKLTTLKSLNLAGWPRLCSFYLTELPPSTVPTVTVLRISEQQCALYAGMTAKLFQNNILILPSLSTLEIEFWRNSIPSFPPSHLLKSLNTLMIQDAMESLANPHRVLQFLKAMSHIKTLVIDGRRGSDFFQDLTVQPGRDVILPNLHFLRLQGDCQPLLYPVVLDFPESRCRWDSGLIRGGDVSRPRPVFFEEIDLCEVQFLP